MKNNLLANRPGSPQSEVSQPTLLKLALIVAGLTVGLVVCVAAIAGLAAFGHLWVLFAVAAGLLLTLGLTFRRRSPPDAALPTGRRLWLRRILVGARLVFLALLGGWLALILWLLFAPGESAPAKKPDAKPIRVVTWNIHCGQESCLAWKQFDWPTRKHALKSALNDIHPDILCVQEATPEQVKLLEKSLPDHKRFGIGRNADGEGEHCAIFCDRQRFERLDGDTFRLENEEIRPSMSSLDFKRICTWVGLLDRRLDRTIRVCNTHLYLTEAPRLPAAKMILEHIAAGDRNDAVLLTADFNATPNAPSRKLFLENGLDSAERAGQPSGKATFQLYGIGLWCIDGILVDRNHWRVQDHVVVKMKPGNTYPSDHFGLLADLALSKWGT